jgi:PST family polysaccharide transporter
LIESTATALLFVLALPWGVSGIAAAWSVSYWTLLIPGFWYAGRPIGFGISALIAAIWRYAAAGLLAGLATTAIIRGTPLGDTSSGRGAALVAIIIISTLFLALYLAMVILFYRGLAPLRQLASLLGELAPSRKATRPAPEAV